MKNEKELQATQLAHPAKAVARTVAAVLVAAVPTLALVIAMLTAFGDSFGDIFPEVTGFVAATVGFLVVVTGFLTRIMAIPAVNSWLEKVKLDAGTPDYPEVKHETLLKFQEDKNV